MQIRLLLAAINAGPSLKVIAYFLMVMGILEFASIGYDEYRGITSAPASARAGIAPGSIYKKSHPDTFHNAIACHFYYATAAFLVGLIMLASNQHDERSDPMSPDYAGNAALDQWGKAMQAEEQRRMPKKK